MIETKPPILGLDTKTWAIHWCTTFLLPDLVQEDGEPHYYGWLAGKLKEPDLTRALLYESARRLFEIVPDGTHIFCEEPLALATSGKTTRLLGLAAGVIQGAFFQVSPNAWWFWVDVASWKRRVLGNGTIKKEIGWQQLKQDENFLEDHAEDIRVFDTQPDLYDAWCLKQYGCLELVSPVKHYGIPE